MLKPSVLGVVAAFGVLLFLVNVSTGAVIATATGVPALGGVVMFFLLPAIVLTGALVINRPWTCTLICFVYSLLILISPVLGPPGFFPKSIIGILFGIILDLGYYPLRRKPLAAALTAGVVFGYAGFGAIYAIFALFLPAAAFEKFQGFAWVFLSVNWLEGLLAGLFAHKVFSQIRNRKIVFSLRNGSVSGL